MQDWTENTGRLKLLIWIMTGLLVLGLVLLVVGMARTASEMGAAESPAAAAARPAAFADIEQAIPVGARITTMTAGEGRLFVGLIDADGRRSILVLDAADGRRLGQISLVPEP